MKFTLKVKPGKDGIKLDDHRMSQILANCATQVACGKKEGFFAYPNDGFDGRWSLVDKGDYNA